MSSNKFAFLDQEPPPGYIAGVGRGAVGFSTGKYTRNRSDDADDNEDTGNPEVNEGGLLVSRSKRDEEDEEADRIFGEVENRLKSRRKQHTVVKVPTDSELSKKSQFSDLKRELTSLTEDEWLSLPEAGDMTRKNKRSRILEQQSQRLYTAPDSILAKGAGMELTNTMSKTEREDFLTAQLDSIAANKTSKDSEELENTILQSDGADKDAKFADLKKGRLILASLRKTEPYRPSSWIQSARLEEQANNFNKARELISQACKTIPGSDEVWLENIRLNLNDNAYAKAIAKEGLKFCKSSVNLWMKAIELEVETKSKKKTIMRALEDFPREEQLWKLLIDQEDDQGVVSKLLIKAIDLCPTAWEFWVALVNISTYDDAKSYLNKARKILHGDVKVWIAACKLEERENPYITGTKIQKLTDRAVKENPNVARSEWYHIASKAIEEGFTKTGTEVLSSFLKSSSFAPEELITEAEEQGEHGHFEFMETILNYLAQSGSTDINLWQRLITVVRKYLDTETLFRFYSTAIDLVPDPISVSLMYAKDAWKVAGYANKAREILQQADNKYDDDSIKLARVELESNTGNIDKAELIAKEIIQQEPKRSDKFWYRYIHILRCKRDSPKNVLKVSQRALDLFPDSWKLHLQNIQILMEDMGNLVSAREAAALSVQVCPQSPILWIKYSLVEEKLGVLIRARSILDKASLTIPNSVEIAVAHVDLEKRQGNIKAATSIAAKNLKQFPSNAHVWYQHLLLIPKMSLRKPEFINALQKTNNSPEILLYLGVLFWKDGKFLKAKSWFDRSLNADPTNGDAWGWLYTYYKRNGNDESISFFLNDIGEKFDEVKRGAVFKEIQKDPKNYGITHKELLELVSSKLSQM
ncbi:prp1 [Candida theae]|uniref:Prp1 n=1 Tax=Candida theae TaxID=1198502 RepID=A0AAD5FWS3_9ASCO|nr:prp1 [Candida theae]KAI5949747.1 prp1 [Candida theae]